MRRFNDTKNYDYLNSTLIPVEGVTDTSGSVVFKLEVKDDLKKDYQGVITLISSIPISDVKGEGSVREEITKVPYTILVPSGKTGSLVLTSKPKSLDFPSGSVAPLTVKVTLDDLSGKFVPGKTIVYEILDSSGQQAAGVFKPGSVSGNGQSSAADGTLDIKVEPAKAATKTETFTLKVTTDDSNELTVPVKMTK